MIQVGFAALAGMFTAKIEPTHFEKSVRSLPAIMSAGLIGHDLPPNEIETWTVVAHAI
jgi:hypothetical protein